MRSGMCGGQRRTGVRSKFQGRSSRQRVDGFIGGSRRRSARVQKEVESFSLENPAMPGRPAWPQL